MFRQKACIIDLGKKAAVWTKGIAYQQRHEYILLHERDQTEETLKTAAPVTCFIGIVGFFPKPQLFLLLLLSVSDGFEGVEDHFVKSWKPRPFHDTT